MILLITITIIAILAFITLLSFSVKFHKKGKHDLSAVFAFLAGAYFVLSIFMINTLIKNL